VPYDEVCFQRIKDENPEECMSTMAWKCYRCDLTFKDKSHVRLHKDISNHSARQISLISK